jgi:hypothetical protein
MFILVVVIAAISCSTGLGAISAHFQQDYELSNKLFIASDLSLAIVIGIIAYKIYF